jgi:chloride channel 7
MIAVVFTIYIGPAAAGSGVVELMGMLNGIRVPGFIGIWTMITKIVGTIFAVSSGLCIGKEGPLAHIGAVCGVIVCYLPFN